MTIKNDDAITTEAIDNFENNLKKSSNASTLGKISTLGTLATTILGATNPIDSYPPAQHYQSAKPPIEIVRILESYDSNSKQEKINEDFLKMEFYKNQNRDDVDSRSDVVEGASDPPQDEFDIRLEDDTLILDCTDENTGGEEITSILIDSSGRITNLDITVTENIPTEYEVMCDVLSVPLKTEFSEESESIADLETCETEENIEA